MSEDYFESALTSLQKYQEPHRLLKILVVIRKEIEWPRNRNNMQKLRDKGCLKQVVTCLRTKNNNILDVTLSILGNCCMDSDTAKDLVKMYNILSLLSLLLKQDIKQDSINGRIFRIIGNICQHVECLSNLVVEKEPAIVESIVNFLKNTIDEDACNTSKKISAATINMAIRALRELLNGSTIIPLVKNHRVLNVVGMLLIKYTPNWIDNKHNGDTLNNIIRLIHEYSRYKYLDSILQLRNTDSGDALKTLASLILLAPRRIVKTMMNFIKINPHKSDLPVPAICENLMKALREHEIEKNENEAVFKENLQCLCLLFDHPANREEIRNKGSLSFLIGLLKDLTTTSEFMLECSILILSTVRKCLYSDALAATHVRCTLLNVLIGKLESVVGSTDTINIKHTIRRKKYHSVRHFVPTKKSKGAVGYSVESSWFPRSPIPSDDDLDSFYFNTFKDERRSPSPSSSSDISFSSGPSQSPPSSPLLSVGGNSDSDDYSPVCSDADERDFPLILHEDEDPFLCEADIGIPDFCLDDLNESIEEPASKPEENCSHSLKNTMLFEIVKLLKWFSKVQPVLPELGSPKLLILLLKCSKTINMQSSFETSGIIFNILRIQDYLLPLMQSDFIPMVYDLTVMVHGNNCQNCKQYNNLGQQILGKITTLAESGCGKGDIAHQLIRANINVKQKLVLVIPYIIRNKVILSKLMVNCGGLNVLMKLFLEKSELQKKTIKVLCAMALKKLGIKNPVDSSKSQNQSSLIADQYSLPENCVNTVVFKLDDGSSIEADRDFLSDKSDYFNKLLCGQFKESHQEEIVLHNVENKSFRCLLHLLHCNINKSEIVEVDLDLLTLLDVIVLTDRYLLTDLCLLLMSCVEQFRITSETVPVIYQWSLESGTNFLRVETIAFALVSNVVDSERFLMFQNLFDLGYSEQLVDDIQKLLERFLNMQIRNTVVSKLCSVESNAN